MNLDNLSFTFQFREGAVPNPLRPMMSDKCIETVSSYLTEEDTVLEWGAGASTGHFSALVKRWIAIEHHLPRCENVAAHCVDLPHQEKIELHWIPTNHHDPENIPGSHYDTRLDREVHGVSAIPETVYDTILQDYPYAMEGPWYSSVCRYWQFRDYVDYIHKLGVKKYDKILIDGRARTFCAYRAHRYLDEDSLLFIDDIFAPHPNEEYKVWHGSPSDSPTEEAWTQALRFDVEFGPTLWDMYELVEKVESLGIFKIRTSFEGEK